MDSRVSSGHDAIGVGLLLDGRGDDGRVWDTCLVETVGVMRHHVGREPARHQAVEKGGKGAQISASL